MTPQQRIRLARRHAGLSQAALGAAVGVQRSAVGHWEAAQGKYPSVAHLREVAMVTGVQFEWLATGRGKMSLSRRHGAGFGGRGRRDAGRRPAGTAPAGRVPRRAHAARKAPLVEVVEQLAEQRTGPATRAPAKSARGCSASAAGESLHRGRRQGGAVGSSARTCGRGGAVALDELQAPGRGPARTATGAQTARIVPCIGGSACTLPAGST